MRSKLYILLILLLFSCKREDSPELPNYPNEPSIKFKSAEFSKGIDYLGNPIIILELSLDYTDGDSNLGGNFNLNNPEPGDYEYDCIITSYKKTNGVFNLYGLSPENPSYYRLPEILDSPYENELLKIYPRNIVEGGLIVNLWFPEILNYFEMNDTLKYTVQILDRDYNFSNVTEIEKIYTLSK